MVENGVLAGDYQGYRIDNNEIQLPLRESCRIQKEIEAQGFRTVRSDRERCAVTVSSRLTRILFRAIN